MRRLKPDRRRLKFRLQRECWQGHFSFGIEGSAHLGAPLFRVQFGKWAFIVDFEHSPECECDGCLPF